MNIEVITIGEKMPDWVNHACKEYLKRLPSHFRVSFNEIPLIKRVKNQEIKARRKESDLMLEKLSPKAFVVALNAKGKHFSSEALARQLTDINQETSLIQILIGGPEGLSEACLKRANQHWSLSQMTFPHPLVRIILCEALYRSYTIINQHPYHK